MSTAPRIGDLSNTLSITKPQLIQRLEIANLKFNTHSVKPQLQAIYGLYEIGYMKAGKYPPSKLVEMVAVWWSSTSKELKSLVDAKKLDTGHYVLTKIRCLYLLLRDAISGLQDASELQKSIDDDGAATIDALRNMSLQTVKPAAPSTIPEWILKLSGAIKSNPQAINLLLSSAFSISRGNPEEPLLLHNKTSVSVHLSDFASGKFPNFQVIKSGSKIAQVLHRMTSGCRDLISHITSKYTGILTPAKNDMIMPGFPPSVAQFLVVRPPKNLTGRLSQSNNANGGRMVLFHGTVLSFLPTILLEGLKATSTHAVRPHKRTLWMAEEPATSYLYAARLPYEGDARRWEDNSYSDCGVLLGCEFLGTRKGEVNYEHDIDGDVEIGRPQPVHVFGSPSTSLIRVRYVFILPDDTLEDYEVAPEAADLRPLMLKAFKSEIFQGA
ncbi:hypothetical protein EYC80_003526 [Monilinia laxa]|uniref:PARP catalytic domain-containing protein n=1 Tax=Monilinia laxa TaxID=61186 RepID=A0A5N6KK89_MONLA|nr:hypothetical protein EYC80_003526 [Monilinia laxa]